MLLLDILKQPAGFPGPTQQSGCKPRQALSSRIGPVLGLLGRAVVISPSESEPAAGICPQATEGAGQTSNAVPRLWRRISRCRILSSWRPVSGRNGTGRPRHGAGSSPSYRWSAGSWMVPLPWPLTTSSSSLGSSQVNEESMRIRGATSVVLIAALIDGPVEFSVRCLLLSLGMGFPRPAKA